MMENDRRVVGPRASKVLWELVTSSQAETITIREIMRALHRRAFGFVLLMVALINCVPLPPVVSTLAGVPVFLFGLLMVMGRPVPWLPRRIRNHAFNRQAVLRVLHRAEPYLRRVERLSRPRWPMVVWALTPRFVGAVVLVLSLSIMLPMMFTNIPPAIATVLLAISLIEEDGLLMVLGVIGAVIALTVSAVLAAGMITFVLFTAGRLLGF